MTGTGRLRDGVLLAVLVGVALVSVGCAAARRAERAARISPDADVAVYRGRAVDRSGDADRVQVTMFARLPDRLHAEVSGSVGGPRLIVDGGGGRLAVHDVAARVVYVGAGDPAAFEAVFGVAVGLEDLVRAILRGTAPPGLQGFERDPAARPGWPDRLALRGSGGAIELELRRTRALPEGAESNLGTGEPAPGMRVEDLDHLVPVGSDRPASTGAAR